jgi:hypothetical protein
MVTWELTNWQNSPFSIDEVSTILKWRGCIIFAHDRSTSLFWMHQKRTRSIRLAVPSLLLLRLEKSFAIKVVSLLSSNHLELFFGNLKSSKILSPFQYIRCFSRKCNVDLGCMCSFYPKKHISKYKKFWTKISAYVSTFYMRTTKFHGKPIFLVHYVEKQKHVTCKPLFSTKFIFFTHPIQKVIFSWNNLVAV